MLRPVWACVDRISRSDFVRADFIYGPAAEKRDLRTIANGEDPGHPAHQRSLVRKVGASLKEKKGSKFFLFKNHPLFTETGGTYFLIRVISLVEASIPFWFLSCKTGCTLTLFAVFQGCYFALWTWWSIHMKVVSGLYTNQRRPWSVCTSAQHDIDPRLEYILWSVWADASAGWSRSSLGRAKQKRVSEQ